MSTLLRYNKGMDDKARCQSCGMPLGTPGYYGTNSDGSENLEYCKFCLSEGAFTEPGITVEDMIEKSSDFMAKKLGYDAARARGMSAEVIPKLKRWKKN